ncbi:UDP-glucose--hexose-1-phosphate uridylyltransferase [Zhouia sp. PK063]|uniref:UDP-glucose--hexose-1-phosphate uridylyltransferase n=1 Tax=Zhouia sp. PK063 TaxID=3373602 RepID=UPI00379A2E3A
MKTLEGSHRRLNILTGEWIMVSPHRTKRPWQGQQEKAATEERPKYDENCYLCPGNTRASGDVNPSYTETYVFQNDFAALQYDIENDSVNVNDLLVGETEKGICKVICFSPDHSLTLAGMTVEATVKVVNTWQKEYKELGAIEGINYVQLFENKGSVMGCSNPHPHGQIWAQQSIPNEVEKKNNTQLLHYQQKNSVLLMDYIKQELKLTERLLYENESFVILTPFWAVWPYEVMIVPKTHQNNILAMNDKQKEDFAKSINVITKAYDKIFDTSFPYSAGIHQSPTDGGNYDHWQWHMSFYPPLLRSATVKKFMVGYEMFAMPQRDITPESAAKIIRDLI